MSIFAGIAQLAGLGGDQGDRFHKKAQELYANLQDPNFDYTRLSAPELRVVAEAFPETYEAIVGDVSVPEVSPEGREAQLRNLYSLERIAQEGLPLVDRLRAQEAQRSVAGEAQRQNQMVLQNLAQRGRLGGGTELRGRMAGDQQAAELARGQGADLASQAQLARLGALSSAGGAAGAIRGQDIQYSAEQANALNRFNELQSRLRTQAAMDAARERSRASQYNVEATQRAADANEFSRYQNQADNLARHNALRQRELAYGLDKAAGQSGALHERGRLRERDHARDLAAIGGIEQGVFDIVNTYQGMP